MLPNRRNSPGVNKPENPSWNDPVFADSHPTLNAFLTSTTYSDGAARVTGSLSVFTKFGSVIVAVNDNDRQLTCFVSAATWDELLFKIELGLAKDDLDWRKKSVYGNSQKPPY